jgi:hypothetical protein
MKYLRPANERGQADMGWLKTRYSFSFADYMDPEHMGFGYLRVINDDWIAAATGFPTHSHRNMEIVTYVISGTIAHEDSLGSKNQIKAGEIQRMTAGTRISHSEKNPSAQENCHLLQIWILPQEQGLTPSYEQCNWIQASRKDQLNLIVAPMGSEGDSLLRIHQNAKIWAVSDSLAFKHKVTDASNKAYWIQIIRGCVIVDRQKLTEGDGLGLSQLASFELEIEQGSEFLFFDMWE